MLEIKVTYFPPNDSEEGALSISERLMMPALVAETNSLPGDVAKKLTRILFENHESFRNEYDELLTKQASRTSVKLSHSRVSDQLNEKNNASDAVLFPFYVTYGKGSNLAERYSIVQAENIDKAWKEVVKVCDNKFCHIYTADEFKGQAEEYGLTLVALQPQVKL